MPAREAPLEELGSAPRTPNVASSPTPSEVSSASSPEPQITRPTPLFRALAMPPPDPEQPPGQEELERRLPGYRRIVIPRELTLIELLKQDSGLTTDEEVLGIRDAKLRVVAERVGLRRLHVLAPRLKSLTLDGSALSSLRDLGIGLVHLKILSVNRCGLDCLDGVWGLGALREFYAAGNRLQDLHPLGALQKLHTLDMADNPIEESTRLWTLGVCGSLRRLTLRGTPVSDYPDYRTRVSTALPMLISLDDQLIHQEFDDEPIMDDNASSGSDFEDELLKKSALNPPEPQAGPSEVLEWPSEDMDNASEEMVNSGDEVGTGDDVDGSRRVSKLQRLRRRPATTEGAGLRPVRPNVPPRPRTAVERPNIDAPARLQILNTLMEKTLEEKLLFEQTMVDVARSLASEIPHAPRMEDWEKFREETGIDIKINFQERKTSDALSAIERLEQIERETSERFNNDENEGYTPPSLSRFGTTMSIMNEYEAWRDMNIGPIPHPSDIDSLFTGITISKSEGNSTVQSEVSLMSDGFIVHDESGNG